MCLTLYPSLSPEAPAMTFSAAGGGGQAAGLWPGNETPRRGSHQAQSPLLDFGATLHFLLTRDWRPGGRVEEESIPLYSFAIDM